MLSNDTIALVKQSAPLLAQVGPEITQQFYRRLFFHHPELKGVFNQSHQLSGKQPLALFSALAAYAHYIDEPETLKTAITRINHKHVSLGIAPEHYPIVGHHLIATLKAEFGEQFSHDIEQAWQAAYQYLADLFISAEHGLSETFAQQSGGWQGQREFTLMEVVNHTPSVKSFYLKPSDEGALPNFAPGQFVSVFVPKEIAGLQQIRQYSLSAAAQHDFLRISVKRDGQVSQYLHTLEPGARLSLSAPAGDFTLNLNSKAKVYISAGVGITPMLSMLATHKTQLTDIPAVFLHANRTAEELGFADEILAAGQQISQFQYQYWLESGGANSLQGTMALSSMQHRLPLQQGEFYLCGPVGFMAEIKAQLLALGVNPSQIFYEVFGPHENLPN